MGQVSGTKLLITLKSNGAGSLDDKPMTTRRVTLTMQNTTTVPSRHLPSRTLGALALFGALLLPPVAANASDAREPDEVYRQVCAHCHAPQYEVGPEITIAFPEAAWEARGNYIRNTVRHGRAAMPAFRTAKISDAELDGLIQALVSGELDDAPAATGEE